jgi:hypothetical protein
MPDTLRLHASLRRGFPASRQPQTGEIRVPMALYALDERRGDIELVLSRIEAENLYAAMSALLAGDASAMLQSERATDTSDLVTLTDEQIKGLYCAYCARPLATQQGLGTYFVLDKQGTQHLANLYTCAPDCEITAHVGETPDRSTS